MSALFEVGTIGLDVIDLLSPTAANIDSSRDQHIDDGFNGIVLDVQFLPS